MAAAGTLPAGTCGYRVVAEQQVDGAVDASGAPVYRIGTRSAAAINLEEPTIVRVSGRGWQDNGWGVNVLGPVVYFATSGLGRSASSLARTATISIRSCCRREYLTVAPGALKNEPGFSNNGSRSHSRREAT